MKINQIRLKNFRNYDSCQLFPDPHMNVIIGKNAQGKTNLLESIVLLSTTRSHRAMRDQDMIREGQEFCKAECRLNTEPEMVLSAVIHGKGKTLMIHQKPVSRSSEFIGKLNAVLFAPSDLELFEAPPKVRRRLMDVEIGKVSQRYMQALSAMMKLLKERNSLLKQERIDLAMLEVLDQQMIEQELTLIALRRQFIAKMNANLSLKYNVLAGENATVRAAYHTITDKTELNAMREELARKLLENRERDRILKTTSSGVHRDDLSFQLNDRDVLSYASQGQRRMIVLAWKLSLIDFIADQLNELPVLLLDDVLSELDQQKRVNLFSLISPEIQTFITTTEIADLLPFLPRKPKIAEIDSGQIRPWKEDMN